MRYSGAMSTLAAAVAEIAAEMAGIAERGFVASYIPELAAVPPSSFGLAVVTCDGTEHVAGLADQPFSIQSVSKLFALTVALDLFGSAVWQRVGREPSGSAFNSIVQLEAERGIPRNPFINAGAIVIADMIAERRADCGGVAAILDFISARTGAPVAVDEAVAGSEASTGFRNAALANYMKAFGNLHCDVGVALGTYFRQCSVAMSCRQLARASRYLANGGVDPATGVVVASGQDTRRINAMMLTCGHYDASGDFAFRVGLPAKSGVGGGIVAIVPGRAAIAVWSPGLGPEGNSVPGTLALERLAARMGWNVFNPDPCG